VRLQVIYQHAPTPDAPGIYRHRMLLAHLAKRGWHVDLISSPINYMSGELPEPYRGRTVHEIIDGVHHHWVRATGGVHRSFKHRARNYVTFAASAAWRGMTLPRPDVVLASSPPLSVASAGRWIARRHRAPYVLEVRDLWPESAAAVGLLRADSRAYRLIDHAARSYARSARVAIVPTPGLIDLVTAHGARDVELVTGAIEDTPPEPTTRARARETLGFADDTCCFMYAGAHGVVNGLDMLLDAAEQLATRETRIAIVTLGDGSAHSELAERLKYRPIASVQMLGPMSKAATRDILTAADVGLHLLRPDPVFESALPTKVLEYLGCHLPFITTVPGLPTEVAQRTGGSFAANAEQLALAMETWAGKTASERQAAGQHAFTVGNATYGIEASVNHLEAALHRAIKTP
jgi:glycosyltransferase involved in cell wall biosynthesis